MEFPVYIRLGPLRLHPHVIFEALAYLIGYRVYVRLRRRFGDVIGTQARWWVIAAAAVGAVWGSKLLFWLEDPQTTIHHWNDIAYLMSGKTIVGGLAGSLIAVEWVKRRIGIRESTGDLYAVPLALGIAVGRIGCFLTGLADDTYGKATQLPWGVNFGDGIPRHPTQLYEIAFVLFLAGGLWWFMQIPHRDGVVFRAFMVSYAAWRLLVDFLKPRVTVLELSYIQWACLLLLLYYAREYWNEALQTSRSGLEAGALDGGSGNQTTRA